MAYITYFLKRLQEEGAEMQRLKQRVVLTKENADKARLRLSIGRRALIDISATAKIRPDDASCQYTRECAVSLCRVLRVAGGGV